MLTCHQATMHILLQCQVMLLLPSIPGITYAQAGELVVW